MDINSIRSSSIPAPRPQDRPGTHVGPRKDPGTQAARPAKSLATVRETSAEAQPGLSDAEQRFFEALYPGAVSELRTSASYARSGVQPDHRTGTLLDRKG